MKLHDRVLEEILEKSENKERGIIDGIPFPYEKFLDYVPSIEKGSSVGILGSSGVGKSTIAREIYVYHALKFAHDNNYPIKILYFALEDDRIKIMKKIFMYYAFTLFGVELSFWDINSKRRALKDSEKKVLGELNKLFKDILKPLHIIDDCTSPNKIIEKCDNAVRTGIVQPEDHVIVIVDNYANITPDKDDKDKWSAIERFSAQCVRLDLCKSRGWTTCSILQTDIEQEKHSFRAASGGKTSVASLEPSTASIAGNKGVVRDFHVMFGIFNPWRYEIEKYPNAKGWDISKMRNHFRSLILLKSNDGEMASGRLGMKFLGAPGKFEELPPPDQEAPMARIYQDIEDFERLKRERYLQKKMF